MDNDTKAMVATFIFILVMVVLASIWANYA